MAELSTFQEAIADAVKASPHSAMPAAYPIHDLPVLEAPHRATLLRKLDARDASRDKVPDRLHIGVAGFYNFDIAATTRPDYMLLLDVNPHQEVFWRDITALLAEHKDTASFRAAYDARKQEDGYHCADGTVLPVSGHDDLADYMGKARWLTNENGYAHLHKLASEGRIAAATINLLRDDERAEAIGDAIAKLGLHTDTCYWSNIADMLQPHRGGRFTNKRDTVFGDVASCMAAPGVKMPVFGYREGEGQRAVELWTGDAIYDAAVHAPETLPPYERLMRHVSAIGGKEGDHHFLAVMPKHPLIITDGPPRRLPNEEREWRKEMLAQEREIAQQQGQQVVS